MPSRLLTVDEAIAIQRVLVADGANIDVDGHFGMLSKQALVDYQVRHNIVPADGSLSLATTIALGIPAITTPEPAKEHQMGNVTNVIGNAFTGLFANLLSWSVVQGYIRSGLIGLGGYLVANGTLTTDQLNSGVGAVLVILGLVWSVFSNNAKKKALDVVKAVDASPTVTATPAHLSASGMPEVQAMPAGLSPLR